MLKISDIAHKLEINPQTIYFYERIGLIPAPKRNPQGCRLFDEKDVERLLLIIRLKHLGMSLEEIKELLEMKNSCCLSCDCVKNKLDEKLSSIDHQINELQNLKATLVSLSYLCQNRINGSKDTNKCTILDEYCQKAFSTHFQQESEVNFRDKRINGFLK